MKYIDGKIYIITTTYEWDDTDETNYSSKRVYKLLSQKVDGTDKTEIELAQVESNELQDGYINRIILREEGVFALVETYDYSVADADGISNRTMELINWNLSGEEQWRINMIPENLASGENYYIQDMIAIENNQIVMIATKTIDLYDTTGTKVKTFPKNEDEYYENTFVGKDGRLRVVKWNDTWTSRTVYTFDATTGQMNEEQKLPDELINYGMMSSNVYDMILTNSTGVFAYNMGDAEPKKIMDYINSDIASGGLNYVVEISDTQFLGSYWGIDSMKQQIALFTYVDPKDIPDKEVISIAAYYIPYDMRTRVVDFNKKSDKYRITVKDYSEYSTYDDYMAGVTKLNNEILAGNIPDIMCIDANMPIDSYISKGLFADINKFLENDPELNREDYLENVFDAYSVDGKLYRIVPGFSIRTVMGKTSDVGTEPGWTIKDLKDLLASKGEGVSAFGNATRSDIMWYAFSMAYTQFIDAKSGKCNFNSEGFIELLEFIKEFPTEINYGDDYDWMKYYTQYRDGSVLLQIADLYGPTDWVNTVKGAFGEPVTFIGFPTSSGKGSVIVAEQQYAISAKSKNKDGAWEFMRYYLTDEYQKTLYYMPVKKSILKEAIQKTTERPYWEDENGKKNYYNYSYWNGENSVDLDPFTQAEADAIYDFVTSVDEAYYYDENLTNIINEDAEAFFAGQKTAKEVADIIQSRAQIYVNENR